MSKKMTASFTSASTFASTSASASALTTNTFSSSVQKGDEFEKTVLQKLNGLPKMHCNQIK
jgi:hypothetical protein